MSEFVSSQNALILCVDLILGGGNSTVHRNTWRYRARQGFRRRSCSEAESGKAGLFSFFQNPLGKAHTTSRGVQWPWRTPAVLKIMV